MNVDQFYGIELGEFPARIAEVALWMMDHIMNNWLSKEFGRIFTRIPLNTSPHIRQGDALEFDWSELLPPEECSYVLGNPPFIGSKFQSDDQRDQVRHIAALGKSGGSLDYVGAWFIKAGEYVQNSEARIGFVATNSITQGEQVAQLWPILFERYRLDITFAHRTFAWGSDARGMAHVHVVIIGLAKRDDAPRQKRLFSYETVNDAPQQSQHTVLSPYLFDAGSLANPRVVVRESHLPVNGLPKLIIGSKPIDGGHYIFKADERAAFLRDEPDAEPYLRPFVGSREFLQGGMRWILHLADVPPKILKDFAESRERIAAVASFRRASKCKPTQYACNDAESSTTLTSFQPRPFWLCLEVSSERRNIIPIDGWSHLP